MDCCDEEIELVYQNHEALKRSMKEEFLRRLDSGAELGIQKAEVLFSTGYGEDNTNCNLPVGPDPAWEMTKGDIIARVWMEINKLIKAGDIHPAIRFVDRNPMPSFLDSDSVREKVELAMGWRIPDELVPFQTHSFSHVCDRCGGHAIVPLEIDGETLCSDCAKADPETVLESPENISGIGNFLDIEKVEKLTDWKFIPTERYTVEEGRSLSSNADILHLYTPKWGILVFPFTKKGKETVAELTSRKKLDDEEEESREN